MTFYYDTDDYVAILKAQANCRHSYVSGMMYVADEDLDLISESMKVECEKCEKVYDPNEWVTEEENGSFTPIDIPKGWIPDN